MRTSYDFSPLVRSSVGFDRLFDLLQDSERVPAADSWPPHDVEKTAEDSYRITLAVPGFSPEELEVVAQPNLLVVKGYKPQGAEPRAEMLYRGLPLGSFERRFELADHLEVGSARFDEGLLTIDLRRVLPDALKPRQIPLDGSSLPSPAEARQIGQRGRGKKAT